MVLAKTVAETVGLVAFMVWVVASDVIVIVIVIGIVIVIAIVIVIVIVIVIAIVTVLIMLCGYVRPHSFPHSQALREGGVA